MSTPAESKGQLVSGGVGQGRAEQRIGSLLKDKYRLDRVLGVGGMAVVYTATHRNQKQFAVKVLHPELSWVEDIRTRFLREGYVANSVKHPGTVSVLDDDVTDDGSAFLVMELLDGIELDQLWQQRGKRLTLSASLAVAEQVLAVLEAAHAREIIHRDLKPANLFVLRNGQVKVLDFGIARLRDQTTNHLATGTGAMMGTPVFMSPEQALAQNQQVDARSDLWSVGATLFTLLSGQYVHLGQSSGQILVQVATQRARSLAEVAPEAPRSVVELVDRALAFEKEARWPSATAMRAALVSAWADLFGPLSGEASLRELVAAETAPSDPAADAASHRNMTLTAATPPPARAPSTPATFPMPTPARIDGERSATQASETVKPVAQEVPVTSARKRLRLTLLAALLLPATIGGIAWLRFLAYKREPSVLATGASSTQLPVQPKSFDSSRSVSAGSPPSPPSASSSAPQLSPPDRLNTRPASSQQPGAAIGAQRMPHLHPQDPLSEPEPTTAPAQRGKLNMELIK